MSTHLFVMIAINAVAIKMLCHVPMLFVTTGSGRLRILFVGNIEYR